MLFAQETAGLMPADLFEPSLWLSQHRDAWHALPIVMLTFIALAGLGYQLTEALRHPSPSTFVVAVVIVGVPLLLAWPLNRALRRLEPQA